MGLVARQVKAPSKRTLRNAHRQTMACIPTENGGPVLQVFQ